jgi:FMNH2-dependent dimethyl sulfone monooxygenase
MGWDLSLIAELNLNDIKGIEEPALDAWSTAAALAAVTSSLELMVAVRPNFHQPALFAKQAANIDNISGGRLALNVFPPGGRTRRRNTASSSTSMTIATRAPASG